MSNLGTLFPQTVPVHTNRASNKTISSADIGLTDSVPRLLSARAPLAAPLGITAVPRPLEPPPAVGLAFFKLEAAGPGLARPGASGGGLEPERIVTCACFVNASACHPSG
eukprot:940041-Rhodomonas_salina.3